MGASLSGNLAKKNRGHSMSSFKSGTSWRKETKVRVNLYFLPGQKFEKLCFLVGQNVLTVTVNSANPQTRTVQTQTPLSNRALDSKRFFY